MNVYFSCSITGGRAEEATYQAIVKDLLGRGHEVPTAHLSSPEVVELEKIVVPSEIFARDMKWLKECDAVVAEVSSPSHGVGYEIAYALALGKPVLCCYKKGKKVSKIITGNSGKTLQVKEYETDAEVVEIVNAFLTQPPEYV
jgi:nucleoside 2-deoxyribosyltransferase